MNDIDFDDLWEFIFVPIAKMVLSTLGIIALIFLLILFAKLVFML